VILKCDNGRVYKTRKHRRWETAEGVGEEGVEEVFLFLEEAYVIEVAMP